MVKLVLASKNEGKLAELRSLLTGLPLELLSLNDLPQLGEIAETGATFAENALIKARAVAAVTKMAAVADDSGLEVDFLQGAPGIYSARFAGPEHDDEANNLKLLRLLRGVPPAQRGARFRCVLAVVTPDGREYLAEGSCQGVILETPSGSGGFGYDPLFWLPELGRTMAELPAAEKNRVSHRARAFQQARAILAALFAV